MAKRERTMAEGPEPEPTELDQVLGELRSTRAEVRDLERRRQEAESSAFQRRLEARKLLLRSAHTFANESRELLEVLEEGAGGRREVVELAVTAFRAGLEGKAGPE